MVFIRTTVVRTVKSRNLSMADGHRLGVLHLSSSGTFGWSLSFLNVYVTRQTTENRGVTITWHVMSTSGVLH